MTDILVFMLIALGAYWWLAYSERPPTWWLTATLGLFAAAAVAGVLGAASILLLGLPPLLIALALGVTPVRRRFISRPLLRQFRRVLPPLSGTEKAAIDAGTVWWDGELFSGRPDWRELLSTPAARLSPEEQAFLDGPIEKLCALLDDWRITHEDRDLPPEVWDFIREERLFGMIIPRRYGGLEFSAFAHSQVVMKLSSRSITAAVTTMVPNSLGPGKLLLHYGTQAQRDYYLPRLARAEEIPCFALTGPRAGSDAGATPDEGVVCHGQWKGKRVLGIRLNWDKRYITLGPVATLIGLAFRLKDPDGLLGNRGDLGITVVLVPRDAPGVDNGRRHVTLDIPFQNGPTRGHNVFVPLTQVIGEREGIGHGWRMLMESLAEGRGISLPALSVGAGKSASRYTGAYARVRRQFNMAIGHFEGVEEALARIAGFTYQMDAARSLTLAALDCGHKPSVLSAIIKYHLTERYRRVVNDAMDIQAGSGICLGPANLIGRAYQAIPIAVTVEGANILTRSLIIFGQGAIRCHPWVLKEFNAVNEADRTRGLKDFDAAMVGHVGYLAGNLARSLWLGLTRGRGSQAPVGGATQRYFQHLNWMSAAFALCGDVAMMTLGGSLKRREHLSARLGDVLSQLYLSSAVLKRYHDQGSPPSDLPMLDWAMQDSLYRIQERLRALFRNLPFAPLGWLLNRLVFPTGNPYAAPDDASVKAAARVLLAPSPARDRLTEGVFVSRDPGEAVGRLELALEQAVALESVEKTLVQARQARQIRGHDLPSLAADAHDKGLIDTKALHALHQLENLRDQVIAVDTFDSYGEQFLTRHEHRLDAA